MKETFLVKHAVGGRTFIDTGKSPLEYSLETETEGKAWRFIVKAPMDINMKELLAWKEELNVFLFQEFEDQPTIKIWFYVKDGPVEYDAERGQLTIVAHSRIEYVPDRFSGKF